VSAHHNGKRKEGEDGGRKCKRKVRVGKKEK